MDVSLSLVQLAKTQNFQNLSDIVTSPAAIKVFGLDVSLQVCLMGSGSTKGGIVLNFVLDAPPHQKKKQFWCYH